MSKLSDNKPILVSALLILDSLHFVFARLLLPHIPPMASAMYVMSIAAVVVGLFGIIRKQLHLNVLIQNLWFFLAIGFLVAINTTINYESIAFIDPGTASMLGKTTILFGLCFGLFWLKERLSRIQILGGLVAVCGVFTITFQPAEYLRFGSLLILFSAFMYALHAAITKRYGEQMELLDFFFFRLLCTSAILFFIALGRQKLVLPDAKTWSLLIIVGILDVTLGRCLYYLALRRLKMSIHAIVLTLSPVVTILWSLVLFDTLPNQQQFLGGLVVISGVLMVLISPRRLSESQEKTADQ